MIPLACAAARAAPACRSAACCNAAPSVRLLDHARYACGPPHALAPTPTVPHCASLSHAASPINASTLSVAAAGEVTGSTPAQAVDKTQAATSADRRARRPVPLVEASTSTCRSGDGEARTSMARMVARRRPPDKTCIVSARLTIRWPRKRAARKRPLPSRERRFSGCRRTRSSSRSTRSKGRCT